MHVMPHTGCVYCIAKQRVVDLSVRKCNVGLHACIIIIVHILILWSLL